MQPDYTLLERCCSCWCNNCHHPGSLFVSLPSLTACLCEDHFYSDIPGTISFRDCSYCLVYLHKVWVFVVGGVLIIHLSLINVLAVKVWNTHNSTEASPIDEILSSTAKWSSGVQLAKLFWLWDSLLSVSWPASGSIRSRIDLGLDSGRIPVLSQNTITKETPGASWVSYSA